MRNLLNFLVRFNNIIVFLLLGGIAIILLAEGNSYHNTRIVKGVRGITAGVEMRISNARTYFRLREINQTLATENASLRERLKSIESVRDDSFFLVIDTLYNQRYEYTSAAVAGNSVNRQKNFFTLDKGRRQGIELDMAVVSGESIAGVVVGVSDNFSIVMSLLNTDFRISARIKSNGFFGSLSWDGSDWRSAYLSEIPQHVTFGIGDTVETTAFSAVFPEGLTIGTVSSFEKSGGDFFRIKVALATDFRQLHFVKAVGSRQRLEQLELEMQFND
jgi:rod shape-determining protein MreC